jgi:hypothetical protein
MEGVKLIMIIQLEDTSGSIINSYMEKMVWIKQIESQPLLYIDMRFM